MVLFRRKRQSDRRELLASMNQMAVGKPVDNAAFMHVRENIEDLNGRVGANDTDLIFLKGLMDSPIMRSLVKVQDRLEDKLSTAQPVGTGNIDLVGDVVKKCEVTRNKDAQELANILKNSHFKALLESHDVVAEKSYEHSPQQEPELPAFELPVNGMTADAIRIVGLRKSPNEPLGLTVQVDESGNLVIARILGGGMIDRQGLLHIGDTILEVNGVPVSSPEDLQIQISKAKESVALKIGPSFEDTHGHLDGGQCYMRALFSYNAAEDSLLPCKEIGLTFKHGDILQIVNQKDPNWWQAKKVGSNGPAGLIPSQELEERRKAFVKPEADYVHKISICGTRISKKKRKTMYQSKSNSEFDKAELLLYEEVTRMPPFKRRTLALIGSQGVGRRTLKNRLINSDPDKFGGVVPFTSRPPRVLEENGRGYWFIDRETMEEEIREHKFLEYGDHNGHLYGSKLDSIRDVIRQGKMCVLDCSPAALKILHNSSEFMPYVIFIAAPGMEQLKHLYGIGRSIGSSSRNLTFDRASSIRYSSRRARTLESLASLYEEEDLHQTVEESACLQRTYEKYIDLVVVNEDFDVTFRKVAEALEALSTEHQWVPVNWVY
ncbi:MAGUK p55 subfamily member 6 isoform X2 [Zootermopsis nevadensis]|uniref:MAGUK p55 subfamily member 6 n=1 Tax=Zootermopsis nevadensis TaxID=136037 RepID=A0A067R8R4_ZOONE|nr:MAGUK p55 subfamily member 6 isoform X2 [Zootermopsis nevadensis]KDR14827.1 MAGUK p55 subfamily member 6 [Zootermopsis nevadensis]